MNVVFFVEEAVTFCLLEASLIVACNTRPADLVCFGRFVYFVPRMPPDDFMCLELVIWCYLFA